MLEELAFVTREELFNVLIGVTILTLLVPVVILVTIRLVITGLSDARARFSLLAIALAVVIGSLWLFDFVRSYLASNISTELLFVVLITLIFAALVGSNSIRFNDD